MYFYSERFILPFSHDEVVHGKATILNKMWGLDGDKFAQAKALYTYMMTHPGKKLNFMGNELGEYKEWDERKALAWNILEYPQHDSFHHFMQDLNKMVEEHSALYSMDYDPEGFKWLVVDDHNQSVFSYARFDKKGNCLVIVANFIGNSHDNYAVPVPFAGSYKEILNTDKDSYNGSNYTNTRALRSKKGTCLNEAQSIHVKLAPFSAVVFEYHKPAKKVSSPKKTKKSVVKEGK